jgi:hypothetical protein
MKSLAHPEWPYIGTPHEWRGFADKAVSADKLDGMPTLHEWREFAVYQKQSFGPELP